jgi:hypothetical protein
MAKVNVTGEVRAVEGAEALADRIEAIVRGRGGAATHGEILRLLGGGEELHGEVVLRYQSSNMVFFVGMSKAFAAAIDVLVRGGRLLPRGATEREVRSDGTPVPMATEMPWATRLPPGGRFKRPHYVPCVLSLPPTEG